MTRWWHQSAKFCTIFIAKLMINNEKIFVFGNNYVKEADQVIFTLIYNQAIESIFSFMVQKILGIQHDYVVVSICKILSSLLKYW